MINAFLIGLFLGTSLILAIGAQNAFVLRQGILRQHVFYVALFCALSDAILIIFGVTGMSFFFNNLTNQSTNLIFGFSSIWLAIYGVTKLFNVFKSKFLIKLDNSEPKSLFSTILILAVLTFANPHVYLDTVILIGSISQQFTDSHKFAFASGACIASFIFFFSLAYGARLLIPFMQKTISWRILDTLIALIMFTISINLAIGAGWL